MAEAAILKDGRVIKTTNLTGLIYDFNGYLVSLTKDQVVYRHAEKTSFKKNDLKYHEEGITEGYYDEHQFLRYLNGTVSLKELSEFALKNVHITYATEGDLINVPRIKITTPYTEQILGKVDLNTYLFEGNNPLNYDLSNKVPTETVEKSIKEIDPNAVIFYQNRIGLVANFPANQQYQAALLITKIALRINEINKHIFPLFADSGAFEDYVYNQNQEWRTGNWFINPTISDLENFYDSLSSYYKAAYSNQLLILATQGYEKVYWLAMALSPMGLSVLTFEEKIGILEYVSKNKLSKIFEREVQEDLVVKIMLSFNEATLYQVDPFLDALINRRPDVASATTLYETLYRQMSLSTNIKEGLLGLSNWVFNTDYKPSNTKGQFVQAVYALWQFSKYNPYAVDESIKPGVIGFKILNSSLASFTSDGSSETPDSLFTYSHVTNFEAIPYAASPNYIGPALHTYKEVRQNAAPIVMPYESKKYIGLYFDNFSFRFNGKKIEAYQQGMTYDYRYETATQEDEERLFPIPRVKEMLYGTYDIFQPVSILDVNVETKTALSTVRGENIDIDGVQVNSLVPLFVLEFIDNAGDRSDAETMIGYVVDAAATFTGVGNISKFRHLRWAATGADTVGLWSMQGLRVVIGGVEFSSGVLGLLANFVECDPNDSFCNRMKTFITLLELSSLAIDGGASLASVAMRRQAARVIEAAGGGADVATVKQNIKTKMAELNANANPADLDEAAEAITNAGYLFSFPANLLAPFKRVLRNRISDENRRYGFKFDIPVNSSSTRVPRFSTFKYVEDGFEIIKGKKTPKYKNTGTLLHNDEELTQVIEYGKSLGLGQVYTGENIYSATEGLILKSFRTLKQTSKTELMEWMTNYHSFLTIRNKVPFCFTNQNHFNSYNNQLKSIISKYDFGKDLTSIKYTGSSLTKLEPPDVDLVSELSKIQIDFHLDRLEIVFKKAIEDELIKDTRLINDIEKAFTKSRSDGRIKSGCLIRIEGERAFFIWQDLKEIPENIKPITSTGKIDFNIFNSDDKLRSIPPELIINIK